MSLTTVRDAIVARLGAVAGIGLVHPYQRYATRQGDFRQLYETGGKVLGWFVHRVATVEREDTSTYNRVVHRWRIEGFMSLDDETQSELAFDNLIEAARDAFREDETIGGAVETTTVDGQAGLQLDDSGPSMFAGVLCHHARLSLATIGSAEVGGEVIDDFVTGDVKWDQAPPDGNTDAEDTIKPEQAP